MARTDRATRLSGVELTKTNSLDLALLSVRLAVVAETNETNHIPPLPLETLLPEV
jgi:hypothetical protein